MSTFLALADHMLLLKVYLGLVDPIQYTPRCFHCVTRSLCNPLRQIFRAASLALGQLIM